MITRQFIKKDIILNVCATKRISKHMKQKLLQLQGETDKSQSWFQISIVLN